MITISCCKDCPARRPRCHVYGECVQYMTERAMLDAKREERDTLRAGAYGYADSWANNRKLRMNRRHDQMGR